MIIKKITRNGRKDTVYDFETPCHNYILGNGLISHNTMEMFSKAVVSGGCMVKGTKIILADGTTRAIEDVFTDEHVLTMDGAKEVTHTWNPETLENGNPECFEIQFDDGTQVKVSDKHKFLTSQVSREWTEARHLKVGQQIILHRTARRKDQEIFVRVNSIMPVGKKPVYDISVDKAEHYVLENGVVTHNTGGIYSSDTIWIIGRQQEKEGKEVKGYNFIINVEKSRYVKEKSKIPITVTFDEGINPWTGLLDVAVETGHVVKPSNGYYSRPHIADDKKVRAKATNNFEFWNPILTGTDFPTAIKNKFKLGTGNLLGDDNE